MVRLDELSVDFDSESTALVVVDMVDSFVREDAPLETPAAREMIPRLRETIAKSREADVSVIYLKPENRESGADAGQLATVTPQVLEGLFSDTEIHEEIEPREDDVVIGKPRYSGFFGTELDIVLETLGIDTVVITGTQTHICCDSTMRGAFFRGYEVLVIEDLVATYDIPDQGWGDVAAETINQVWFSTVATNFGEVIDHREYLGRLST